jgi:hypothetical protein
MSVRLFAWNNSVHIGRIFFSIFIGDFAKICGGNSVVVKIEGK